MFWMTMMNHAAPTAPATLVLTTEECKILDQVMPDRANAPSVEYTLAKYLIKIARLGGYLARSHDPPPGNIVMWRGWQRLMDISIGFRLPSESYG
jgi:hypothetical protein